MLDRIYNEIAKADLMVADLTCRNPNVFYETGYAHALGKRVILLTKNADDIPFDLKHHFHIVYGDISNLKEKLGARARHFFLNPAESTADPFRLLSLLANGVELGWDAPTDVNSPWAWNVNACSTSFCEPSTVPLG